MNKLVSAAVILAALGTASFSWAIEPLPAFNGHYKPAKPATLQAPQLQLKGELKIISQGMSGEFCTQSCEPFSSDFKLTRLKCHFFMEVKNVGNATSKPTQARVIYSNGSGNGARGPMVTLRASVPAMRRNEVKRLSFRLPGAREKQYANTRYGIIYDLVSTDPGTANSTVFHRPL